MLKYTVMALMVASSGTKLIVVVVGVRKAHTVVDPHVDECRIEDVLELIA